MRGVLSLCSDALICSAAVENCTKFQGFFFEDFGYFFIQLFFQQAREREKESSGGQKLCKKYITTSQIQRSSPHSNQMQYDTIHFNQFLINGLEWFYVIPFFSIIWRAGERYLPSIPRVRTASPVPY